jgi:methionyl-tRNA formyltransferase
MKIVLCGQKRFGRDVLKLCQRLGHEVATVYCPLDPDDKLRIEAENSDRLIIRPAGTLRGPDVPEGTDLIVCAHSHDFVSRAARNRTRHGAIGYHPSLLPLHRGRDAVRWAIRARERVTGGSVYWMTDTVDGGPIAAREPVFIRPDDTALSLWSRDLAPLGLRLMERVLRDIAAGRIIREEQDHTLATWEPSFSGAPAIHRPEIPQLPWENAGRENDWRLYVQGPD